MQSNHTAVTYRWVASVYFFIAGITFASWASRIPDVQQQLQLSEAQLGTLLLAIPIGLMAGLPLCGWLVSRWGAKATTLLSALCYSLCLWAIGWAQHVYLLAFVLFLFGVFGNLYNVAVNTMAIAVQTHFSKSIMATFHGIWSIAGFSGAALGALMVQLQMPPRAHFTIVLIAVWMVALFVYRWALPDKPTVNKGDKLFVLPDKALLGLGIMAFCCLICEGTMFDWSGVYFKKVVAAPTAWVPLGYVAFMCCMSLGRFISDSLVTRWGAITILKVSGLLIVAGLLLSVVFPNIVVASIGFMLVGFGVSSVVPLVYALAGKSKHMPPGLALTAVSTIGNFGFLLGPPLIGFIAQAASLRWSFVLIAILGCFVALLAKRTDR